MESRHLRVFLCHATQDKPKVFELYNRLQSEDWIDPWLDIEKLLPGQDWDLEINRAIRASDVIIICVSTNSVTKEGYVQKEIKRVLSIAEEKSEGTIYIIPLRLDNSMLPIRINQYQGLDYFSENAYDKLLKSLNTRADGLNLSTSTKITTKLSRVLGLSKPISDKVNNSMQTDSRDSEKNIVETIVGEDQEEYSKDIWDYLVDMPYMPSRTDRDKLIKSDDPARVQIWDYFFRIKKEDVGIPQQKEINATRKILKDENLQINKNEISTRVKRIKQLEHDLELLRRQIPTSPSDSIVRQWFTEHLDGIIEDSKIATGLLSHRLIDIGSQNPIPLFGPGELQNPERFPPTFTDINTADDINFDIKKHLTARRAVELPNGIINVLFGVYYFECVLIANDMLATYGLFFDFITGKSHAIKITEQYYRDVVSIAMTTEFRWIEKNRSEKGESRRVYVDDAPTFTISLASGEKLTVTFINEKYFLEIKDKINVLEEDISRIYLIQASRAYADNAIKAIRFQLRLHKTLDNNDD